jgi:hypothetical protein
MNEPREGTVEHSLWRFALLANKSSVHPLDWNRFYQFIVYAHQRRIGWDASDVAQKLKAFGFSEPKAQYMAEAYWHARCALFVQNHWSRSSEYCRWAKKGAYRLT